MMPPELLSLLTDITVETKHHKLGYQQFFDVAIANGSDPGTRGLGYDPGYLAMRRYKDGASRFDVLQALSGRQRSALHGWVIESAALDHMGQDPRPRLNGAGRDGKPEAHLFGYDIDYKFIGNPERYNLYVKRCDLSGKEKWLFIFYGKEGTLLGWALGEDFIREGGPLPNEMPEEGTTEQNICLPLGYNL
jgi:hypothetical protein